MKSAHDASDARVYSLPIGQWHALGMEGSMIPVTICLEGDSMRPLVRRGRDKVTILPLARPLIKGDIVLFRGRPERYVVHRVYRLNNGMVRTLGDNCMYPDPWMPLENVWGLVVKMERSGRIYRLDTPASRAFGRIWMLTHPIRHIYRRFRSLGGRIYRKVFRRDRRHESA